MFSTSSSQLRAGWMLTSMTPGSGVSLKWLSAVIVRRRVALDQHRQAQLGGGVLDGGDQVEVILQVLLRRHEDVQPAVARLDAQGGADRAGVGLAVRRRPIVRDRNVRPWDWTSRPAIRRQRGRAAAAGSERRTDRLVTARVLRGDPRQRVERQAKAHRRIAGDQVQVLAAQEPAAAHPRRLAVAAGAQRQRVADDLVQALLEDPGQAAALLGVVEIALQRIDVDRQLPLAPEVVPDVLVAGDADTPDRRPAARPGPRRTAAPPLAVAVVRAVLGDQARVVPDGTPSRRQ